VWRMVAASYAAERKTNALAGNVGAGMGIVWRVTPWNYSANVTDGSVTVFDGYFTVFCPTLHFALGKWSYVRLNIKWGKGSLTGSRMAFAGPVRPAIVF